ncbi:gp24 [Klebsiella pneumoniae]|uniref:TipJ family phage tail tip protein n=2 Tax=Klebsiella pneumoniae TaxID=573 RepID=UPI000E2DD5C2|nr:DUF1983 domain-containing protein [Klebsiella pneumoniae]SWQ47149.1 gp24 [Klebsiella pneumoniae]
MANNIIKGRKGGSSKQRTPTEQPDDLQSVAKAKILIALGEGEFAGGLTGKDIYLDGTPLENADGSQNFSGVAWEFRPGTQAQSYIQGIPGTENEISVGTEVSSQTAWTHTFTNTQLSAVRVRLKWPSLMKQEDDGDVVGNTVKYAIDLQTDGGAWQTVLETAVSGKTTSGYERSHRIDLPQAGSTWTLRLRKVSPDANSVKIGDVMTLQSYTEVIDAKLRYPHTALLYIEFDSSQFNGSIPQISCEPRGRVIRVPDNYNPETREYTGTWTGGFKWAWTDNPAWIYYDIVVSDRFGLGDRLTSANISKWALYPIAQYCDQLVPDGRGGDGMEPRYICNVYVQERNDAYTVLRDFAAIFRGMTCWSGEQIIVQADMPRDVDFNYTRANILGSPRYSSSTSKARYTNALVSWSDPDNAYADAMEPAFIPELVSRYSFNQLEVTAIGCTRQSEAHRKGLWGILTNNKDRMVEIDVGLDGRIPQPGYIIGLGDERLAGRVNGGRISAVNGRVITLDRDIDAKEGDRLHLNLPSGISQARTIQSVNGRRQVTVTTAYSETPEAECVWIVEYTDLVPQQYRVIGVKDNNNGTLTITGVAHDPDKFPRIDIGAIIDQRPVSVLPAGNQSPPDDIVITSRSVVNQGISVETMQVNWSAVSGAIAYEAQWRRNDGNWINVPRSSTTSFEVSGIYAGRYLVRVRAINAAEISSGWAYSEEKTLTGKVGEPLAPLALATRSLVHGVQVSWEFPTGSGDTLRTELQYSKNQDGSAPMPLSDVAYPGKSYQQMGLSMGAEFWYRARLVDRLGNESPWTGWVQGMASDNFDDYYENLTDAIKDTAAWEETQRTISETQEGIRNTQQELEQTAEALRKEAEDQAKQVSQDIDASAKSITADVDGKISAVNKTITDELTSVNESLDSGLAQANKGIQEAKSAVADANQQIAILSKSLADGDAALNAQIKTAENGLKQSLSQVNTTLTNAVKQETADRIADVNAKAAQAADELLAATQGIEASIESLTQVMKSADENLAREMSSLAAGANIQFDSQVIWHFNNQTTEGWTGSAGVPGVSQDGWLRPADSATDPYITSPGGLAVDGAAYRFIMLRFRKTGKPVWAGEIRWVSAGENFNNTKRYIVAEPEYADGVATLTVRDIPWTGNIDRIRLDLTNQQDASNFIEFDWIAVGRPAPGASTAALQDVRSTLSNALTAEAQARSTLAAQMRGSYEGSDLEKVTSGLLYQEKTARVTAISAEVKARESLQTQFNDNKAAVSGELSSLTTEQSAQASRIGGLETSLGKKADATALTSLTQKVEQQGATLTSQGTALTSLTNRVGQTETGLAGTNEALSGLESTVTQQGDRITSQGQSITKLTSDLGTTNAALAKKAEASAVTALTQQVEQNGQDIRSNTDSITSLSNQLVNGQPNSWSRRIYPVQLANAGTVPSFSDIRAVAPVVVDEAADAAKLDFTSSGSYLIALYSCQVKVAADTTITMAPGNRVFDDTGAVFVNGVQVAWGNASTSTVSFELKAGWNTVEFLVNQWTGQAYINLGLKLSDKVAEMYSGLGVSALANAAGVLSSNVSQIGNDVVSNSQSITQLRNALTQTDANVASKADQTAMNSLTGRVEKTESGLTAANANITSLKSAVRAGNASGGDLIPNPTFDPTYDQMGFSVVSTTAEDVPSGCPYGYAARIASRDHHPNFAAFPATLNDVIEISALVACGAGTANFNLYVGTAVRPDTSTGAPLMAGGGKSPSATWQRTTWRFKVTQAMVDRGYIRPFLQISQNSPYGTVWFVTDWHMRNVTAAQKVQDTADATAAAVDSLTTTVTQQGNLLTSTGNRTTQLENGLATTNAAVAKKADATAVQDLTNTVKQLGNDLTAANSAITKLTGNLANTDKALAQKADATALATLDTKVTQQGKTLESQSNSLTNLQNSLNTTNAALEKKAEASAVTALTQQVEQNGQDIRSNTNNLTSLSNRLVNGLRNSWSRRIYPIQLASGVALPSFSDIRAVAPTTVDEVADTTKLDFTFAGSYLVALYSCQVKVAANTTVTMGPGSRVFDDTGVVFVNGVQVAWGNASTSTVSFELKAGWNTVEFLVNQWTGQAYINLGLKLSDKVDEMYSGLGVSALSNAAGVLSSNVSQIGKDVVSNSQSITQLRNSLTQTDANVAGKADQTALNSLTGRVENTETGLTAANSSITSLNTSLSQQSRRGANLLPDGTFESYPANYNLSNNRVIVSTDDSHGGNKCIRVTRPNDYNATGIDNSDNHIFSGFQVRDNAVFYLECWIKLDAKSTAMADNVQISVGLSFQYQDESWQWPAVTKAAKDLSSTQWTKVYGYLKSTKSGVKQAMFRISVPNVSSVKAGNSFLIDDIVLTEVTDAYNAQNTADANASAISTLNSTVSQQGDQLTSQGNSITKLTNDLATTNNNVSKKADATALTTLANRVTQTEKDITSTSSSVTTLNNKVDSISVGGTNLIKNSGAMTGWSNVISETYRGNAVLGATTKAGSGYKDLREITLDAPVDAGEYVYSFYAKGAVDGQPMTVFFYNPNTTKSSETSQGIKSGNTDGRAYFTLTTSWARYWVKWKHTPTTGTKRLILCRIESNASNDQTVYISSPKLEVGNVVSDWNNSPTDSASASAVDLLTTTVNQHSDTITSIGNRTTSLENGLSTTNANVAKKADASSLQTLQNTVTQQGNDISSQGTRVTAIENSLTSGANLIPNAKMLNNAQGWDGNATTVDGYAAVSSARGWQPRSAPFEVTPGDTLDLSLMCLVDAAITFAWGLRFDGPSLNNKTVYTNNLSYQAGEKKAVSGTFVVPVGATTARLQPNIGVTAGVTIYNVVVTRRDATTIANSSAIDSLTSTVKTQGDAISSIGNRTTSLENGLATAQNDIGKKADASALQDLRNTVTSQGGDLTAANSSITSLQASMNRRTVFTVTARGLGNSVTPGVFDESGKNLFSPGRSWALVTFAKQSDGSAVIATSKTYDVFGSANNGDTMSADIGALTSGTYVCVLTFDEPSGNRGKILSALESLGGTSEVVNSLPYRGAYILLGRKGMRSGDGLELRAPTGGDATAHISTSVEFVNGIMMGLGAAGGVMMKADANASAITTLQNTVKTQGGNIDSLSSSITALENSLRSTNDTVSKKADTTAVSSLTGRVSQVENTITSQSQSITSLTSSINTISTQGANPWVDGTFESYGDGHVLGGGGTAVVVASQKFTGNKSLQVSRGANDNGNSDKQLGSWQSVREDAKFRFEFWAMMPADQAPSSGWTTLVGIQSQNAAGQNAWQAAVTISEASLGARDKWVKFTGIASNNGAGRTRAVVWISTRGATGNGTPGYSLYIDDLVITDVTDAKAAQDASDATASAVSGLTARVTDAEGKITAQAQQQTALASKVDNANSRVDNMAKTLSDSQSTQASLNTSLQSQIDAQAAANIKNQTTLDNTIKSVASITSTQQTHATALEALATQQTTLTSSVGDLSASVQNTAKTVADVNGTVSSLWSMKVETVNGKKVGAGITLGSNGETSDMILYADRFSLFNRNNATAVPVMVAEGNELYIDTARIKNSSLTSTKIADGSITNAKIGNEIRSNDFVDGSRGWRIAKDGSSQFNNVIVRGRVEANSGVFKGTVQAESFIGDIATSASFNGFTVKGGEGSGTMNAWYQNSGYPMTITLNCTVRCNSYSGGVTDQRSDFYVVLTFNINGVQSKRRVVVDMRDKAGGLVDIPQSFTVNIPASNNRIGISLTGASYGPQQSEVTVGNIVVTAFRSNNGSFGQ